MFAHMTTLMVPLLDCSVRQQNWVRTASVRLVLCVQFHNILCKTMSPGSTVFANYPESVNYRCITRDVFEIGPVIEL